MGFEASYLANHTPITPWTSRRLIVERLDRCVGAVIQRKLPPIDESAVHELVKHDPRLHGPDIDYFQRAYGAMQ